MVRGTGNRGVEEAEPVHKSTSSDRVSIKSHHAKSSRSSYSQSSSRNTSRHSSHSSGSRQDTAAEVAVYQATSEVMLQPEKGSVAEIAACGSFDLVKREKEKHIF